MPIFIDQQRSVHSQLLCSSTVRSVFYSCRKTFAFELCTFVLCCWYYVSFDMVGWCQDVVSDTLASSPWNSGHARL